MEKIINAVIKCSKNYDVYAVGGFVRDFLLKQKTRDIDLAVSKDASGFAEKLAKELKVKVIVLDDIEKIYRIVPKDKSCVENIDISLFNGKTIEKDLLNRDFTVNAAAFDVADLKKRKQEIICSDKRFYSDIKKRIIHTVSKSVFKDDPLRMLRAFRFCAELGFEISPETLKQIKFYAPSIKKAAPERIKNEFFRILSSPESLSILKIADKYGLLEAIFPEIKKMKKVNKKYYYHPGGLFQHSFETAQSAENILNKLKKYFPDNYAALGEHFSNREIYSENVTKASLLKFAALFHDCGKPETAKKEGKKMRFFGHEEVGALKTVEILTALKAGKKEISAAKFLIENHMRPSTLTKNNVVTEKASMKFFRDIGDNTPDLLILSMADWHSYKHLKVFSSKELKMQEKSVRQLVSRYFEVKNAKPLPKLIDGNIIMKKFNLKPGPWLRDFLDSVTDAQIEGKISDKKEALNLISSQLSKVKKKYGI